MLTSSPNLTSLTSVLFNVGLHGIVTLAFLCSYKLSSARTSDWSGSEKNANSFFYLNEFFKLKSVFKVNYYLFTDELKLY